MNQTIKGLLFGTLLTSSAVLLLGGEVLANGEGVVRTVEPRPMLDWISGGSVLVVGALVGLIILVIAVLVRAVAWALRQ